MFDMTIRLQEKQEKCLYEQIYAHIRQEIIEGKLLTGERLPSTRSLAEYLQVARSTVEYAYDQLLSEGYIESVPCKGFFVCETEELLALESHVSESWVEKAYDKKPDAGIAHPFAYDFSPHKIDMSGFPFSVWKRITKNILTDANSELFAQGEPQGDWALRETISRYLHSSRGVNCTPDQIVIGAGNDYLLMLLEKILGRQVPIAMENPTYKRAYRIFQSFAYDVRTVEMDESGMRVSQLDASGAKVAYVMPSHQFPTGTVMPIGRRMELLRWAKQDRERYLIEDDYDSEFRYRGKPIPALQASDDQGKVIYIGTFSKAIAPAIRVSYMVLPHTLLEQYRQNCSFYSCTVSRIDQRILDEFIRDGAFERHINKMRKQYREKHDLLLESLKPFASYFKISGENAGLHVLLTTQKQMGEQTLIESAAKQGVKVYGLSEYRVDPAGTARDHLSATILLGYGGLHATDIVEGVTRLKKGWLS